MGRGVFLAMPTPARLRECYRQFYRATSQAAVETAVCAVCARSVLVAEVGVSRLRLRDIPHRERLIPQRSHAAHTLFLGMLLEPAGVMNVRTADDSTFQRGMRGTVSSYELNTRDMASMINGDLMPRPPSVLASVLSITFVGVGRLPKTWLRSTFRVRRHQVARALQWLKVNNPKYYGSISISHDNLAKLPEDDVPEEVMSIVRQSTDAAVVLQESDGYVPEAAEGIGEDVEMDDVDEETADAAVIPLTVSGAVDTDLSKMSANELMLWGLANMWNEGREGGYLVRHGSHPVRDFPDGVNEANPSEEDIDVPNFFERAFPCLFPYGCGGFEARRPVKVDLREHVRWALQYHDRRFRLHESFAFVCFAILQRRQALASARVQIRRRHFDRDVALLSTITVDKLRQAEEEERNHRPITDPAVRLLRSHMHATASRVQGSDQARYQLRSQIWSTVLRFGGPTLWMTWNPSDLHDPLAQVFAGADINLDTFERTAGPSPEERARNVAADPYAAAQFFHFTIRCILETLLQVRSTSYTVKSAMGALGRVSAYIGSVESQGRGTLHLHLLLWLDGAPSPLELQSLLQDEAFRARVAAYIRANIHAYVPGFESAESVQSLPKEAEIAYSRPPNPDDPNFDEVFREMEIKLARAEQVHTCRPRRCLVFKGGRLQCKRRAPFPCSEDVVVLPSGEWAPKRLYGYINGWCPSILVNVRCNNDIKLLTNGEDTRNITFYVACYSAKKQGKTHNLSALMAKGFVYHETHPRDPYVKDLREQQRLLLYRLVHTINMEQELAAVMVISYLMDWGDVYRSHSYSPIFWSSFVHALYKTYPELRRHAR
ncbi:hypothetical protein FKP32DRAFT_1559926 [Trametes sanguinea]|nr:hypothetical protein FKP32DRAFT_1559926 [Trametes sanguinea]